MTVSKKKNNPKSKSLDEVVNQEAEVLYQRIGNKWYSFCVVNDEVFVGEITDEMIHAEETTKTEPKKSAA